MTRSFFSHGMAKWGLFMVLLFVVWFAGWFVFARYADGIVKEQMELSSQRGISIECDNQAMRGFPFRIGLHCDDLNVVHNRDVFRFELGALRTAAQLYAPGELIAEIDGPFRTWQGSQEISAKWKLMRLFLDAKLSGGFELASLNFTELKADLINSNIGVESGSVHFRPSPVAESQQPGSLDGALDLNKLSLSIPGLDMPQANVYIDATLEGGYADLVEKQMLLRNVVRDGARFDVRSVMLSALDGGRLAISGPIEIDAKGYVNGNVRIGIAEPKKLGAWIAKIDPKIEQMVTGLASAISAAGQPAMIAGQEFRSIDVSIKRGKIKLGFIHLGKIPPLF